MKSIGRTMKLVSFAMLLSLVVWIALVEVPGNIVIHNLTSERVVVKAQIRLRTGKNYAGTFVPDSGSLFPETTLEPGESLHVLVCRRGAGLSMDVSPIEQPSPGYTNGGMTASWHTGWGTSLTLNVSYVPRHDLLVLGKTRLRALVEQLARTSSIFRNVL